MMRFQLSEWSWLECLAPGQPVMVHSGVAHFGGPFPATKAIFHEGRRWEFRDDFQGWHGNLSSLSALLNFLSECLFNGTIEHTGKRPENKAALIFGPRAAQL